MDFDYDIDSANLRDVLCSFPEQFKKAIELTVDLSIEGEFDSVCIVGMGGSSMPGALLDTYLGADRSFPIYFARSYSLPSEVTAKTLLFCISYSGNTEETLTVYDEAIERDLSMVCVASGGELVERAVRNEVAHVQVPSGLQPRFATGYQLTPLLVVLSKLGMIKDCRDELAGISDNLNPLELEERGKELALSLRTQTPVFYASDRYEHIMRIMKIKFNENAKTPAFWNVFPELNHNEMNGWMNPQGKFHVVMIKDALDHERIQKRMDITARLVREQGTDVTVIDSAAHDSFLLTMLELLLFGDWASYYLALAYGQDPTPVDMVENLKKELVD